MAPDYHAENGCHAEKSGSQKISLEQALRLILQKMSAVRQVELQRVHGQLRAAHAELQAKDNDVINFKAATAQLEELVMDLSQREKCEQDMLWADPLRAAGWANKKSELHEFARECEADSEELQYQAECRETLEEHIAFTTGSLEESSVSSSVKDYASEVVLHEMEHQVRNLREELAAQFQEHSEFCNEATEAKNKALQQINELRKMQAQNEDQSEGLRAKARRSLCVGVENGKLLNLLMEVDGFQKELCEDCAETNAAKEVALSETNTAKEQSSEANAARDEVFQELEQMQMELTKFEEYHCTEVEAATEIRHRELHEEHEANMVVRSELDKVSNAFATQTTKLNELNNTIELLKKKEQAAKKCCTLS